MKKNVVFTDFDIPNNWEFINTLNEYDTEEWIIENKVNNKKIKNIIDKIKRYFIFVFFPFNEFLKRNRYNKIIAWQQFYGLMFAFYCNLFKVNKVNKIIIMTFIYTQKKGFIGKIKKWFTSFSISSKYVDKIIVFSKNEVEYYAKIFPKVKEKFVFTNLGVDIISKEIIPQKGDYFVTAGKSNRDYNFLIDSFSKMNEKLKIISYTSPNSKSNNVEILRNTFDIEYYRYLAKSFAVIISLDDPNISAGQLVFVHAMQLGKPIICTSSNTVNDYVINKKNGIIIEKNVQSLKDAVELLKNNEILYDTLSKGAYELYCDKFSIKKMALSLLKIID